MTALPRQSAAAAALLMLSACGGDNLDISEPITPATLFPTRSRSCRATRRGGSLAAPWQTPLRCEQ